MGRANPKSKIINPKWWFLAALLAGAAPSIARAQRPVHFQHAGILAPGLIGAQQLARGGPLPGYFQPLEIRAPEGTSVWFADQGRFDSAQPAPAMAAMLVGVVYRLRVTGIPKH